MAVKTSAESAAITLGCLGVAVAAPFLAPYLATISLPFFGTVLAGLFKPGEGERLGKIIINTAASWFTNLGASAAEQIPAALTRDHNFHLERMLATAYLEALAEVENEVARRADPPLNAQAERAIPLIRARIKDGLGDTELNALFPVAPGQLSTDEAFANRFSAEKVELMTADPERWRQQLGEEVEITLRRWLNESRAADDRTAGRKILAIPDSEPLPGPLNAYLRENLPPRIAHRVGELVKKEDFKESWIAFQRAHLQEIVRILNRTETTQDDIRRQLGDLAKRFERFASSGELVEALAAKLSEFLENVGLLTKGDMESLLDNQRNHLNEDFSALLGPIHLQLDQIQRQQRELSAGVRDIADASGRPLRGIKLETGRAEAADERVRIRPTELLLSRYCIAPFVDRGGLRDSILSWIIGTSGRRAQGRIYVAPGGFGKTRLAIELLVRLESLGGWRCGFIFDSYGEDSPAEELSALTVARGAAGVCVFVDHAESRIPKLRQLADAALAAVNGTPLRIVAFARSVESWWTGFAGESAPSAIFDPTPFDAIATEPSDEDRSLIFEQSRSAFVDKFRSLGLPYRERGTAVNLAAADRPLFIAAMAFLDAAGVDLGNRSVFQTLYEEERRQWRRLLQAGADDEVADLARAAAQVTLVQGTTLDGAKALLQADDGDRRIPRADVLVKLRRLYGVYWIRRNGVSVAEAAEVIPFINEVEPDMLGEHMCIQVLEESGPSLLSATLRAALGGRPLFRDDAARILTVLARATHPNHDPGIRRGAERAIESIATLVPSLTAFQVVHLANSFPPRSIALSELVVVVARRMAEVAPAESGEAALRQRADTQSYLSARLSDRGHDAEALAASEHAVKLHRELVDMNRREHLRGLAAALHLHSQNLVSLGRRKEAVSLSEEAVELNREIAAMSPEMLGQGLAESLRNLGETYATVGRKGDALTASRDACSQFESLAAQDPAKFRPALAGALNSLGNRLFQMDQSREAFEATSKAVEIDRQLVAGNRDRYLSGLASALNNLSRDLFNLQRKDEALAAILEAVKYHRELVDKNRGGHLLGLALALQGSGHLHFDAGQQEEGLAFANEAIGLLRELMVNTGDAHIPDLARTLCNLGTMQRKQGRFRDACRAFEEGAKLVRPLALKFPEAYRGLFEILRDQYTQTALETPLQPPDSELAPSSSKRHPIPEGSTAFDEADRLLQVFEQAVARHIDLGREDEDAQAESIVATESAMDELWVFLTENSTEEIPASIGELARFLTDLLVNGSATDKAGGEARSALYAELVLAVNRVRVRVHPEDMDARGAFAKSLMRHADASERGAELLQELHELRKANPEDPTVRELDAIALYCESNNAAVRGDEALANLKLDELRDLSTRHSKDGDVRAAFAKTLEISGKCAIDKGDVASRDARLNELRSLVLAFPDDGSVRLVLAEVLFAAGAAGRLNGSPADEFFAELYSIVTAHPDDNPLSEFFNARFRTSHTAAQSRDAGGQ